MVFYLFPHDTPPFYLIPLPHVFILNKAKIITLRCISEVLCKGNSALSLAHFAINLIGGEGIIVYEHTFDSSNIEALK